MISKVDKTVPPLGPISSFWSLHVLHVGLKNELNII